jgi:ATP phosphoribosyltransferase regulatory subunit
MIDALRGGGEVVIVELPGHESTRLELGCDRILMKRGERWEVEGL